jgi:hypothetical protein
LREDNSGSTPAGVGIFLAIMSKWNYDQKPESALEFEVGCFLVISFEM